MKQFAPGSHEDFAQHGKNIARAAGHAGINRRHFRKLLIDHGLREPTHHADDPEDGDAE